MAGQQASTAASALSYKGASIKTNGGAGDGVVGAVAEGLHLAGLNRDRAGGTESRSRAQISHLQVARAKFVEAGNPGPAVCNRARAVIRAVIYGDRVRHRSGCRT